MHFVAPNRRGVETKVITNADKSIVYSLTDSGIVPGNLMSNLNSCYQIGDYVVVKYNNSYFPGKIIAVLDESAQVKWPAHRYDVFLYKWCNVI